MLGFYYLLSIDKQPQLNNLGKYLGFVICFKYSRINLVCTEQDKFLSID